MFESSIIKILVINAILHWHTIKDKRTQTVPNDPVKKTTYMYSLTYIKDIACRVKKKGHIPKLCWVTWIALWTK